MSESTLRPRGVLRRRRLSWRLYGSIGILVSLVLLGIINPTAHSPIVGVSSNFLTPPGLEHPFGTDRQALDVLSRTLAAASRDVPLAVAGMLLSLAIAIPVGLFASSRNRFAEATVRSLDAFQAFPVLLLAIIIVVLTDNTVMGLILAIAAINAPRFIRLIRSRALSVRESRFVEAAVAIGCPGHRVMGRHVLPNLWNVILAQASLTTAHAIIVIASLSFLGIGITPPNPSWGLMIRSGVDDIMTGRWWTTAFPALAILVTVLALNTLADTIDERFGSSTGGR